MIVPNKHNNIKLLITKKITSSQKKGKTAYLEKPSFPSAYI